MARFALVLVAVAGRVALAAEDNERPLFVDAEIEVQFVQAQAAKRCSTGLAITFQNLSTFSAGHPDAISRITWSFLGRSDQGDHYRFTRTFPAGSTRSATLEREVIFTGKPLVLWSDHVQQILLRPGRDAALSSGG